MKRIILSAVLVLLCSSAVSRAQQPYGWRESSRPGANNPRYARVASQPTARDTGATHAVYWQRVEEEPAYESGDLTTVKEYPADDYRLREYTYSVPVTRREYVPVTASQPTYGASYGQPTYTPVSATYVEPSYGTTFVQQPAGSCTCPTTAPDYGVPSYGVPSYGPQVRPGLFGQPSLYVPGQPVRNVFRFLSL
jgi:hypothetical protein